MIVHEDDAIRTIWCPHMRVRWPNGAVAFNRPNSGIKARFWNALFRTFFPRLHWLMRAKFFMCRGRGCMMWRWHDKRSRTGYCGLASPPLPEPGE